MRGIRIDRLRSECSVHIHMPAGSWKLQNTHDNVPWKFRDGQTLEDTVQEICYGSATSSHVRWTCLPPIYAIQHENDQVLWCLGNTMLTLVKKQPRV